MRNREELKGKLSVLADGFAHSYCLSFKPRGDNGFHLVQVRMAGKVRGTVAARMSYWVDGSGVR